MWDFNCKDVGNLPKAWSNTNHLHDNKLYLAKTFKPTLCPSPHPEKTENK